MSNLERNIMAGVCIVLTLAVIGVIIWLAVRQNKDNFCGACQNIGLQVDTNRELLHKMYNSGELTENSELVRGDQWKRGPAPCTTLHRRGNGGSRGWGDADRLQHVAGDDRLRDRPTDDSALLLVGLDRLLGVGTLDRVGGSSPHLGIVHDRPAGHQRIRK